MKICAFSDGHGILPVIEKPIDLLLIGGDNVDLYCQRYSNETIYWYTNDFVKWINNVSLKEGGAVLWIDRNHEVGWQKLGNERFRIADEIQYKTHGKAIYLEDSLYNFNGITVYGTPQCKVFGNWAFMQNDDALRESYSKIIKDCDILLTHDAPYGVSDICYDWIKFGRTPYSIGNVPLRDAILEKSPKINIHGHLHSANHNKETLDKTDVYCVSIVNEEYDFVYEPLYLEYDQISN